MKMPPQKATAIFFITFIFSCANERFGRIQLFGSLTCADTVLSNADDRLTVNLQSGGRIEPHGDLFARKHFDHFSVIDVFSKGENHAEESRCISG